MGQSTGVREAGKAKQVGELDCMWEDASINPAT